jgi:Uma2 family endonuclease
MERASLHEKHEYFRGEIYAMTGASRTHVEIIHNLNGLLYQQRKKTGCRAYANDLRVKVQKNGLYTYPDIAIVCGEPQFEDDQFDTLLNPLVIIEVLSPSTERYDRGTKFQLYQGIDSLQEYVLVSQDQLIVERFRRTEQSWVYTKLDSLEATLQFDSLDLQLALAEIYETITFEDRPNPR